MKENKIGYTQQFTLLPFYPGVLRPYQGFLPLGYIPKLIQKLDRI